MERQYVADRFRLDGIIDRGNMGEVHRAEDTEAPADSADRRIAVKLILRRRSGASVDPGEKTVRRFAREVDIMRRLDHPGIPRLVDGGVDTTGGHHLPYLAMEYLDGRTLRDLGDEEPQLPVPWVAAIGAQIADALYAAHAAGVVHRDLKPANVMIVRGGRVKVLDFGMGRIVDDPDVSQLTSADSTVGTARYMAPEQFQGAKVTSAADLYALGCVLYELLGGTPPFSGATNFELGHEHNNNSVPPLGLLRNDIPADLTHLVERLLAKKPADRPANAAEVRDALRPLADGEASVPGWDEFDPLAHVPVPAPAPLIEDTATSRRVHDAPLGVMDVFSLHKRLIDEYSAFTSGSTVIRDERIDDFLKEDLKAKSQWPDPWLSLNPFFDSGGTVTQLVNEGLLHPETARIFQARKKEGSTTCDGRPLTLHRHQREAVETARSGRSYVLTTGTGSGKSLSYIVPIVDRVLREREQEKAQGRHTKRVRAVIVYPMNALANSQLKELEKFLVHGYGKGREPVTFARYTGQESEETRKELRDNPPDILLTNYVMLELMLTRPDDRKSLIKMARGLDFLVFDELHTYRGRQGADVAMLVRRVRQACEAPDVQCVGTSATMSSEGTAEDQKAVVASVATKLFGTEVAPGDVITETLVRATVGGPVTVPAERLTQDAPRAYHDLYRDPLARWIESTFGLTTDSGGRLVRQRPTKVEDAAAELARDTGVPVEQCVEAVRRTLEAGAEAFHPGNGRPLFAFRLHQFLSKGDTIHVTLEHPETRHLTREYQLEQPGSEGKILLPLAFCRECGQEYMTVWRLDRPGGPVYQSRRDTVPAEKGAVEGYLYVSPDNPWPTGIDEVLKRRLLPESWLELDEHHQENVSKNRRDNIPRAVTVDTRGNEGKGDLRAAFIRAPFLFCLHCGVNYESKRGKDFGKLATLDQEGRSSATSLISGTIVRALKAVPAEALPKEARKLLTFVDNRQDASLQAGHFNDFVQVTELRGGLYRALHEAGEDGLSSEHLATRVAEALALEPADYAKSAGLAPRLAQQAASTLRDVIAFRLFVDLERGWRVTMPNLEQTGLLRIDYADLDWTAEEQTRWDKAHSCLAQAAPHTRKEILRALLDEMRRALAIDTPYFRDETFESLQSASETRLSETWALARGDRPKAAVAYPMASRRNLDPNGLFLSGRGKYARYLKRVHFGTLTTDELQTVVGQLLEVLADAGLLTRTKDAPRTFGHRFHRTDDQAVTGYQIDSGCLVWKAGDGVFGAQDPLTRTYASGEGPRVNTFFRDLYLGAARSLTGLVAREHTAQVPPQVREERENLFSDAELKLLYCSPTMELGVDIKELNAVLMRNVPPTPANYAQRSGRGGRSGQPALITTYCATGNSHDQYYFRHSDKMVSGVVQAPRLELANEDLATAHVQAIWLAETGLKLGRAIPDVVHVEPAEDQRAPDPALPLADTVQQAVDAPAAQRRALAAAGEVFADVLPLLRDMAWWDDSWLERVVRNAPHNFDRAFDRWRGLLRAALLDQYEQNRRVLDHSLTERDRRTAARRRGEAETQITLLKNESQDSKSLLSDFNPYRYLASEGFLPGYSFPRLPLAAYIPTRRSRVDDGDFLQRPRFVAIREFGPGALIYHEGARYQVTRVQLPPDSSGDLTTTSACRCDNCGYHHETKDNLDRCELCDHPLSGGTPNLLQLHTVYTTRREKISSDEEERRRAGFRLVTSYRFQQHGGGRSGRQDAKVSDASGPLATLHYGDSATVRITNLGRLRAKDNEPDGFWLDPTTGKWLNEATAKKAVGDTSETPLIEDGPDSGEERVHKKRVIPYVEDRRNILVVHLDRALPQDQALTLMYALERGIEAAFELEDAELTSELLPPEAGDRDRMLFTEAAEGGAGVLRRLQVERDALARAARTALQICHIDPEDGTDTGRPCARGCYDCLLTYHNQAHHQQIDRRLVRDLLLRLAEAQTLPTGEGVSRTEQMDTLQFRCETQLERDVLAWLKERGHRLPDDVQVFVPEAQARPDFVYRLPHSQVAVFVDGPVHEDARVAQRDAEAEDRLYDAGWDVVRFAHDADWGQVTARNEDYFGQGAQR
ncbi:protein kinase domain-containing protein [Nocardiopsis algeriensis]|uniref:Serine/threonine protein kinase/very-short-patch-repair endonuclease n=1 Tax=Nocardiopsis algeriensis TaxID=1478215 RepID=A0A841IQF5_9ACTN|nr:protein kinase [Nocardiopsis algeriensis]MBB6119496.1 serine/threonine protein kinase/very-short-patch-repair endonuclease [Nocardiopsis algeriensis]